MDEDEAAIDRLLADLGVELPDLESDAPDDAVAPRLGDTDELGGYE